MHSSRKTVSRRGAVAAGAALTTAITAGALTRAAAEPRQASTQPWKPMPPPPQIPVVERSVPVPGGGSLWCWDTGGDGQPIVLLHPHSGSGESWPYQQPALAKQGYRVVAYSRRDKINSVAGSNAGTTESGDLHTVVEHLGLTRFHLLGSAAGGSIAIDYALSHGERLHTLTIASSIAGVTEPDYLALSASLRPPLFRDMPLEFQELGPSYRGGYPNGVTAWLTIAERALVTTIPRAPAHNQITWPALEALEIPVLLMTGDADLYTPPSVLRVIAGHLPRARTVIVPEAGHNPHWEQPEFFNDTVTRFLRQNYGRSTSSATR